jgi:hypothetical protein
VFYVYPAKDEIVMCNICKNKIKINVSVEFTCTTIENTEQEQKVAIKQSEDHDYTREAYLAGHRSAYDNFRRPTY